MTDKTWWILVGGRKRLGRALAEFLAYDHSLVLTSSTSWEEEAEWLSELSMRTQVRTLCWNAENPGLFPKMMADLEALCAERITLQNAVILSGSFPEQPFGQWDREGLQKTFDLNLVFPMLTAQALAPAMGDGGVIQFILDTAIHKPMQKRLPYSAAKSGLAAMVPGLARMLAPKIRVVGHALGVLLPDESSDPSRLASMNLLKQNGTPGDLLRAIRYAAESPYLTGDILTLDGGRRWA